MTLFRPSAFLLTLREILFSVNPSAECGLGTGIQRIHRLMKDAGLPDPEFKPADKRFKVILYRPRQVRDNLVQQGSVNQAEISARPSSATGTASPSGEQVSVWNVPFRRNPFFTGREPIVVQIHSLLHAGKTTALSQPPAISGLGGIGKTQTAVEYAYRYREEYQQVLWVQANTSETLLSNFVTLAGLLKLPEQDAREQQLVVHALKQWLETHSNWLLIFDNADELAMVRDYLPEGSTGHILLTTRAQAMGGMAHKIELDTMDAEEGAVLLLRRAGFIAHDAVLESVSMADRAAALDIVRAMDGLPLALDQAGAYIEETGESLSNYLNIYHQQRAELLKRRGGLVPDHPSVTTTWSLAFKNVERANPAAIELMNLCAFLAPDAIPEELIMEGAPYLGPVLEPVAADRARLNAAIAELLKYSLVRRNVTTQTLTIHRLVQAVIKDELDEETQRQWAERAVRAVNSAFPDVEYETWEECKRLLPDAWMGTELIQQWHMEFEEAARLLNQTGQYLQARAQYAEAEPLYQRALTMREHILGSEHPDVAQSLNNLALLYQAQGKYERVEPLYQRALAIDERVLGPEHPEVVTDLNNLALLYYNQRKYAEAEPLYQRALIIDERVLGPEHPEVSTDLNNLALLYQAQGKYGQAEPFLQRALVMREKILGPEHPDTAISLNNLASLYYYQGKYIQAEPLLQRALMIWEKVLGPEHPSVATSLENYATLLRETKREQEAGTLEERARAIRARHAQENPAL